MFYRCPAKTFIIRINTQTKSSNTATWCCPRTWRSWCPRRTWCRKLNGEIWASNKVKDGCITWPTILSHIFCYSADRCPSTGTRTQLPTHKNDSRRPSWWSRRRNSCFKKPEKSLILCYNYYSHCYKHLQSSPKINRWWCQLSNISNLPSFHWWFFHTINELSVKNISVALDLFVSFHAK